MATMNLNTWLEQVVFPGTDLNWDLWGKLSPAEQNQILGSFNTNLQGLSDPTKIQEAMNKGSFDYVSEQERGQQGSDWMGDMLLKGLTAATIGGGLGGFENLMGGGGLETLSGASEMGTVGIPSATAPAGGTSLVDIASNVPPGGPTATDWTTPDILGEDYARGYRAPTSPAPRVPSLPAGSYPTSGVDQASLDLLEQARQGTYLNNYNVDTLPGWGGSPVPTSPIPSSSPSGGGYQGYNPNQYLSGDAAGTTGEIGNNPWWQRPAETVVENQDPTRFSTSYEPDPGFEGPSPTEPLPGEGGGGEWGGGGGTEPPPGVEKGVWEQAKEWIKNGKTAAEVGRLLGLGPGAVSLLGKLGVTALGVAGANSQAATYERLANKFAEYGAPYRSRLAEISADPSKFYSSPAAQGALAAMLQKLSPGGNPFGDPYKQSQVISALYDRYGSERDRLAGFGGLTAYNAAAPGLMASAAASGNKLYDVLGYGLGEITNPRSSLEDLLARLYGKGGGEAAKTGLG